MDSAQLRQKKIPYLIKTVVPFNTKYQILKDNQNTKLSSTITFSWSIIPFISQVPPTPHRVPSYGRDDSRVESFFDRP